MSADKKVTADSVMKEFDSGCQFKASLNLFENVEVNENFYIGKQWEGVQSNGLPTPVFNFIKRIIMYVVASTSTDNLKINATPLSSYSGLNGDDVARICEIVNAQFVALFEQNKLGRQSRDFMRDAAVRGDACLYSWFDPDVETGQTAKGAIKTEILENTRVIFGNPNSRDVQSQPYIIVSRRESVDDVKREMRKYKNGGVADEISADADETNNSFDALAGDKVTTVTRFWKQDGTVHAIKVCKNNVIRAEWDMKLKLYPLVWMNWDYVTNCYHGQAAVTGLIPNQIFVNKMFAMTMISLMTTAYPKIVYDKTRIRRWDNSVGTAIGVNGGDVSNVARAIDPAMVSPQVGQFIELAISLTKEFMGATDAALGDTRPDNTSAIIALQKASSVPMELTKQNFFQCIEDLGNIWLDQMRVHYGTRYVETFPNEQEKAEMQMIGVPNADAPTAIPFDFGILNDHPLSLKLDVGGSAYWSEIAQMNTLDNLLMQGQISVIDYLERVPNGYISNQQELINTLRSREQMQMGGIPAGIPMEPPVESGGVDMPSGAGYGELQRAINQTGMEGLNLNEIRM